MMQDTTAKWILKNRELHQIPMSVMEEIIKDTSSLFTLQMEDFKGSSFEEAS